MPGALAAVDPSSFDCQAMFGLFPYVDPGGECGGQDAPYAG